MKTYLIAASLLALVAPVALAANPAQSGTGGDCVNDIITFVQNQGVPPPTSQVAAAPGTLYSVSSSADTVYVDFFTAGGAWVGWNGGASGGFVPTLAAYGVVCPAAVTDPLIGIPLVPDALATWTYQDGL